MELRLFSKSKKVSNPYNFSFFRGDVIANLSIEEVDLENEEIKFSKNIVIKGNKLSKISKFLIKKIKEGELNELKKHLTVVISNAISYKKGTTYIIEPSKESKILILVPENLLETNLEFKLDEELLNISLLDYFNLILGNCIIKDKECTYPINPIFNYNPSEIEAINKIYIAFRLGFLIKLGHLLTIGNYGIGKTYLAERLSNVIRYITSKPTIASLTVDLRSGKEGILVTEPIVIFDEFLKYIKTLIKSSNEDNPLPTILSALSGKVGRGIYTFETDVSLLALDTPDNLPNGLRDSNDPNLANLRQLLDRFVVLYLKEGPIIYYKPYNYDYSLLKLLISIRETSTIIFEDNKNIILDIIRLTKLIGNKNITQRKASHILRFLSVIYLLLCLDGILDKNYCKDSNYFKYFVYLIYTAILKYNKEKLNYYFLEEGTYPTIPFDHEFALMIYNTDFNYTALEEIYNKLIGKLKDKNEEEENGE